MNKKDEDHIDGLLRQVRLKKREYDAAYQEKNRLDREYKELVAQVYEEMEEAGAGSRKLDVPILDELGRETGEVERINFVPQERTNINVKDRAEFVAWCQENGRENLIHLTERKADVNAFVKTLTEDGKPLPPGLGRYDQPIISQRAG